MRRRQNGPLRSGDKRTAARLATLYDWMGAAIVLLICLGVCFVFLFRLVVVQGDSMNPTLADGEKLVVSAVYSKAERGDVVIVRRGKSSPLVKRVIAVEGDRVAIDSRSFQVMLNGRPLKEEYAVGQTLPRDFGTGTRTIPEGYVMVLGDNRENSRDSRCREIGLIPEEAISGRVLFRFYPLERAGWIR